MGATSQLLAVYIRCTKRQNVARWGHYYQPAIHAVRSEAPKRSWASRVHYYKHRRGGRRHAECRRQGPEAVGRQEVIEIHRRRQAAPLGALGQLDLHLFGETEFPVAFLALYHPGTLDIQEQKVFWAWPTPHPLDGSPYYQGPPLPHLPGMLDTVKRLGHLDKLARIHIPGDLTMSGQRETALAPFIGDLLLFQIDAEGPYCVNWNIKGNKQSFIQPAFGSLRHRRSVDAAILEALRHSAERENYAGAAIRTVQIVGADLDDAVFANLRCLYYGLNMPVSECAAKDDLEGRLVLGLDAGTPPRESFTTVMHRHRCQLDFCIAIAQRMIWERRLLVDLYSPILWDLPLRPMTRDVLSHYAHWFRR